MLSTNTQDWIFINPETYVNDEVNTTLSDIIREYSSYLELDTNISNLAYAEREKVKTFFEKIIDQSVYNSKDHEKIRTLLIDWYASHRTEITKARKSSDLNLLTNEELNEFMLSYGFPYPRNISSRSNRIQFLSNLINNYRKKGTSETLANIISLYGLRNIFISEWWIRYDTRRTNRFYARSNIVHPQNLRNNRSLELEKSYEEFIVDNPHWQMTYDELVKAYYDSPSELNLSDVDALPNVFPRNNKISLPSITNVVSIEARSNLVDMEIACATYQRKMQESLNFWVMYSLIPIKVNDIANFTIVTSMYNTPPSVEDMNADLPYFKIEQDLGEYNGHNNVYLVGPDPTDEWAGQDFERKLVKYNSSDSSWALLDLSTSTKWSIFLRSDSVSNANNLLVYNSSLSNWSVYSTFSKDACFPAISHLDSTSSVNKFTMVYNGDEWVDLHSYIPTERILNRNENIFRDIPLNNFTSLYSLLEIQLAIAYLHNGGYSVPSSSTYKVFSQFNYNGGDNTPLDRGYTELFRSNNTRLPLRNDIDELYYTDAAYEPIKIEYRNLVYDQNILDMNNDKFTTFRHLPIDHDYYVLSPREMQDIKKQQYYTKFTKKIHRKKNSFSLYSNMNGDFHIRAQMFPELYLKAINPTFLDEINTQVGSENTALILENILVDFENYAINTMNIIDTPFAYIQTGGEFYNQKLKTVVNFFKPFRVRILEFLTKFDIYNPLLDSQLVKDNINEFNITEQFIEKPFPRNLGTNIGEIVTALEAGTDDYTVEDSFMYVPQDQYGKYNSSNDEVLVNPVLDYLMGHGLATEDYYVVNIEHTISEPSYSPLDNDLQLSSLDISMNDAFFITVTEGGNEIFYYKIDDGTTVMADNTLTPTDADDLEDEIQPE
jgi:hypothetical protein